VSNKRILNVIAVVFITVLASSACSATPEKSVATEVACLNDTYSDFQKSTSDSEKNAIASKYLACFPDTFSQFEQLFGYDATTDVKAPLLQEYQKFLNFLANNYSYFDKNKFSEKFINIATSTTGSVESVDAENELQAVTLISFRKDPSISLGLLSKHNEEEITAFWTFSLNTLEHGVDTSIYSCPPSFNTSSACVVLSKISSHTPNKQANSPSKT
jgi:hypothetical protein